MKGKFIYLFSAFSLLIINYRCFSLDDREIFRAMHDELIRNTKELSIESVEKPYYIEYKLSILNSTNIKASLGSVQESSNIVSARLSVDVRVGGYKFDNSNFFDFGLSFFGSGDDEEDFSNRTIPVELDYGSLRRELWLATDAAYKQSAEIYSKKLASLQNKVRKDTTHDFLFVKPEKNILQEEISLTDIKLLQEKGRKLSAIFTGYPDINVSTVTIEYNPETVYYVNSEGMEYKKTIPYAGLEVVAATQSADGMPVSEFFSCYGFTPSDFPKDDSLVSAVKSIAVKLSDIEKSQVLEEPYSGPVLFEGQAAAEIFAQVFAPNLVTQRAPLTESGIQDNDRNTAFQSKIGGRVLPEFLNLEAIPNKETYGTIPLMGYYKLDDEGVKPQDLTLVEKGYLRTLLSSRVPTKRVRTTNGSNRGGAPMISSLRLYTTPDKQSTPAELKQKLIKLVKDRELPYGFIVRKVIDQNIQYTTLIRISAGDFPYSFGEPRQQLLEVYKVFPDGSEQLVRGCETKGLTVQSFKDIIGTGNREYVLNYLAPAVTSPYISGGDQYLPSTIIVPDLLFEDAEINPIESNFPKPPILENPLLIKK